jgi:hypothetical protein
MVPQNVIQCCMVSDGWVIDISLFFVAVLAFHLEKEHEERHCLTDHLWTKMK